ncbi:MAG: acyl-CoA dehydrogenase family protein [Acidimicrobiales bacterium]
MQDRNQPPPLEGYNLFDADPVLAEGLGRSEAAWATDAVRAVGERAGEPDAIAWGFQANTSTPVLRTHDRFGDRIDEVEFHPAWHALLGYAVEHGMAGAPWAEHRPGAHVARAVAFSLWSQVEAGMGCPVSMTYASVPTLRRQPELAAAWEPLVVAARYEPGLRPAAAKAGALVGMAMTERQGGSDVRTNLTRAEGSGGPGTEYRLSGDKWFCSAPMCDAFLVLAQAPGGLSCFLLPRVMPDGTRNAFRIERLKDKLGNRSNASSEVVFEGAVAFLVGEEGRGVRTIVEMVNCTRLDCVIGSTALMRQAVAQATHHAAHRVAFGNFLVDQPLMRNVLADLAVESEAAGALMLRLAAAMDASAHDEREALLKRIATPVGKFWVCKRATAMVGEALECLGGNGYVEESIMPRLLRESPLNSVWEGSGNVNALDVLRAVAREPDAVEVFLEEAGAAAGADRRLDEHVSRLRKELADTTEVEARARRIVEAMALALQGSLVVRHSPPAVADAFCASRLGGEAGLAFGTLPPGLDTAAIVERHRPKV